MATVYAEIDGKLRDWLLAQPVFFVGSAPLSAAGHVNVSPKGMDGTFAVLGPHRVGYLDYYGSGAETIAHLRENGRIVIMCCAFTGPPKIVRLHGRGRVVLEGDPEYAAVRAGVRQAPRPRAAVDHCGRGRPDLGLVRILRAADGLRGRPGPARPVPGAPGRRSTSIEYGSTRNAVSIDGLPALAPERVLR